MRRVDGLMGLCGLLFALVLWGATWGLFRFEAETHLDQVGSEAARTAGLRADVVRWRLAVLDTQLRELARAVAAADQPLALGPWLAAHASTADGDFNPVITDGAGHVLATATAASGVPGDTVPVGTAGIEVAAGLYLSGPEPTAAAGWSLTLSRLVNRTGSAAPLAVAIRLAPAALVDPSGAEPASGATSLDAHPAAPLSDLSLILVGEDSRIHGTNGEIGDARALDLHAAPLGRLASGIIPGPLLIEDGGGRPGEHQPLFYAAASVPGYRLTLLAGLPIAEPPEVHGLRLRLFLGTAAGLTVLLVGFLALMNRQVQVRAEVESRLAHAIACMSDGFILFDAQDRVVAWNEQYERAFPNLKSVLKPGLSFSVLARFAATFTAGADNAESREAWVRWREERHRGGDQTFQQELADGRTLETSERRTIEGGVVGVTRDISALRDSARALAASEARFRDFAEVASDWFWETGANHRFIFVSDRAQAQGIVVAALPPLDRIGETGDPDRQAMLLAHLEARHPFREMRLSVVRDNRTYRFALNGKPVFGSSGEFLGYRGSASDVSRQLQAVELVRAAAEAAEAANRSKSDFLANMSHEIRTPMNGVIGLIAVLKETPLDAQQRTLLQTVSDSAETLVTIIDDVLDYSKLEAGKIKIESVDLRIEDAIEQSLSLASPAANVKGLSLRVDYLGGPPPRLRGDPTRLQQVLTNLIGNAIKFSERGTITIIVGHHPLPDQRIELVVEVRDQGIGISSEAQAALFDRFVQADASTTRRFGGSGLGLAICRQLIRLMGGEIGMTSEMGTGSTFWFRLPMEAGAAGAEPLPEPQRAARGGLARIANLPPLRILCAEDNEVNRLVIAQMLTRGGHVVDFVTDGAGAVAAVEANHYDLVLMDIHMPEMDGPTATSLIRALPGAAGIVPIVALTANAMRGDRERYLAAGMNDYVSKPINPDRLFEAMARTLGRHDLVEEEGAGEHPDPMIGDGAQIHLDPDQEAALSAFADSLDRPGSSPA